MNDTLNLTQLCRILGVSAPTVRNYIAKGLPVITEANRKAGVEWEFSKTECLDWYEQFQDEKLRIEEERLANEEDDDALRAARLEKLKVETARLELRLRREQGEVVPIDSIARIVEQQFTSVRQQLLSLPHKLAPLLAGKENVQEINELLSSYIHETLSELKEEATLTEEDDNDDI